MPSCRLLVVDDDPFIAALLRKILAKAGHEVVVAADGPAALEVLEGDGAFQAVLLDRRMPGMDGLQVLARLKADPRLRDIPVVLQTSLGGQEEIREGLAAGAFYYLVKPLDPPVVLQVVSAALADFAARRRFAADMEGVRSAIGMIRRGVFHFRTLPQCHALSALLGKACPDPLRSGMGLSELMINALEHGNLGITYEEKSRLIEADAWAGEVDRRQDLPGNRDKVVQVSLSRSPATLRFRIQDMGAGFAWQAFQEVDPERLFDNHGRGILIARFEAFDRVRYLGTGSTVVAEIDLA